MNNGTGKGGKGFNDRVLAAEVRTLTLEEIKKTLSGELYKDDPSFKKAIILKLSGTILPRLNVQSGDEDNPVRHNIKVTFGS